MTEHDFSAFWLYPDWDGPVTQPFWMRPPKVTPFEHPINAESKRCIICLKYFDPLLIYARGACYLCERQMRKEEPYRQTPLAIRKPFLCWLGFHKMRSYSLKPWLFVCERGCGRKTDHSFQDPTGVQVYPDTWACAECDMPIGTCCEPSECVRSSSYTGIPIAAQKELQRQANEMGFNCQNWTPSKTCRLLGRHVNVLLFTPKLSCGQWEAGVCVKCCGGLNGTAYTQIGVKK